MKCAGGKLQCSEAMSWYLSVASDFRVHISACQGRASHSVVELYDEKKSYLCVVVAPSDMNKRNTGTSTAFKSIVTRVWDMWLCIVTLQTIDYCLRQQNRRR